jgi:hypothetical protein
MKRLVLAIAAFSAVAAGSAGGGAVQAARTAFPAAASWGRAIEVPGLGILNKDGYAQVTSLSCASAGSCAAGGYYSSDRRGDGFVATERDGVWGKAIEVPGLAALDAGGGAEVLSVSCARAGSCAAGGIYADRSFNPQGFVVAERNGVWGKAIEVPGLGALNKDPNNGYGAEVDSISCASAGNCSYGGIYLARHSAQQGFVAAERNGVWGKAIEIPGLGALNKDGGAEVASVSCASAGNCVVGGSYVGPGGGGFVAAERNGRWGKAIQVPGLRALGGGGVNSVSCARAGSCAAGGIYIVRHPRGGALGFVASERNGRWGRAIEVPGLDRAVILGGVNSVSCAAPGDCVAGGRDARGGFVAAERNGHWGKAITVPGLAALDKGRGGDGVVSVSCASPGNCAAGGAYADRANLLRPFVVRQDNGRWGKATQVPGLAALNKGTSQPFSQATFDPLISCSRRGPCVVGGTYVDGAKHSQGFVTQTR